jgi:ribosomal protein L11 methylase PrmA
MIDPQYFSYRDPNARVVKKTDGYYRYIFVEYQQEYDHLMQSGLYQRLIDLQLMIPHKEVDIDVPDPTIYKLLYPQQIPFQSYPYEWSYVQWRKAILAFLQINQLALDHGMILKDATPFNFFLSGGAAVLLDTSSFIFYKTGDPWIAYRQFCEEFLAPFALMHYNGAIWARLYQSQLHGMPLSFVSKELPRKSWLNLTCLLHLHLHASFQNNPKQEKQAGKGTHTREKTRTLLNMIQSTVSSWKTCFTYKPVWVDYYDKDIASNEYLEDKKKTVEQWLAETQPASIIDLGANTGMFSLIAANHAQRVIALEYDDTCVDRIEKDITEEKISNLTALTGDLTEVSPALGLLNQEYLSLISRAKSELAMGLALIHHLCIAKNLSMEHVAEMMAQFSTQYAIVEFVPKEDPKVQFLLKDRTDIFSGYNENNFVACFEKWFDVKASHECSQSKRRLYFFRKKG